MRNRDRAIKGLADMVEGIEVRKNQFYQGADIYIESRPIGSWAVDKEVTEEAYE